MLGKPKHNGGKAARGTGPYSVRACVGCNDEAHGMSVVGGRSGGECHRR